LWPARARSGHRRRQKSHQPSGLATPLSGQRAPGPPSWRSRRDALVRSPCDPVSPS
jgi:hypothetical protein